MMKLFVVVVGEAENGQSENVAGAIEKVVPISKYKELFESIIVGLGD